MVAPIIDRISSFEKAEFFFANSANAASSICPLTTYIEASSLIDFSCCCFFWAIKVVYLSACSFSILGLVPNSALKRFSTSNFAFARAA